MNYIRSLDGLRAVAVMAVVVAHSEWPYPRSALVRNRPILVNYTPGPFIKLTHDTLTDRGISISPSLQIVHSLLLMLAGQTTRL